MIAIAPSPEAVKMRPGGITMSKWLPFIFFYILLCDPADLSIGPVSLSLALFPIVLYGYSNSAKAAFSEMLPGARKIALIILGTAVVFCGWGLVTAIGAPEFLRTFRPLYGHASGLAMIFGILALSRTNHGAQRTRLYCIVILSIALAGTYLIGVRGYSDRYPGTFKHPNQLGIVALMVTSYCLSLALSTVGKLRIGYIVGTAIALLAIMLSGSKTNLLLLTIIAPVAVVLTAMLRKDSRKSTIEAARNIFIIFLVFVSGLSILAVVNERAYLVLTDVVGGEEDVESYHSVTDRNELWRESWQKFQQYPLTGVGAGQPLDEGAEHSHNVFMDTIRTTGAPGFGLITFFIGCSLWYVLAAVRSARRLTSIQNSRMATDDFRGPLTGSLLAMVSYVVANQMSDSFGPSTIPFFYMFFGFSLTYFLPDRHSGASTVCPRTSNPRDV